MGVAENLATHTRWAEADGRRDLSHHHEFIHEDIVVHHLDGADVVGLAALIKNMEDSIAALPDYSVVVEDRFATDDRVVCRWRVQGTPSADGGSETIDVEGISVWEFQDGKAKRGWVCSNATYLMHQGVKNADAYSVHAHDHD